MSSKMRPTLITVTGGLTYKATYYRVLQAVNHRRSLIHGKLEEGNGVCAIGAYFREANDPINTRAIDEIAAYNDSFPKLSPSQRWRKVIAWLRFEVQNGPR